MTDATIALSPSALIELWGSAEPMTREQRLQMWQDTVKNAARWQAREKAQRNAIFGDIFPQPKEGTNNFALGNGWVLKAVHKFNYNLATKDNATDNALEKLEKSGEDGKFVSERLVKFKPELSVSEYRMLSPAHKKIIDQALTITPSIPTMEIVPPKGSR